MIEFKFLHPDDWEWLAERNPGFFRDAKSRNLWREYQHYHEKIEVQGFDALNDYEKGRIEELRVWRKIEREEG